MILETIPAMLIKFLGACREVTGSSILIEANGKKILLECGLFQGVSFAEERNYSNFEFNPGEIDAVILGHAHLDHVGRLPKLTREGFCGKIYSTAPTLDLTRLVLRDSEKLGREEAKRGNHLPLYDSGDIEATLNLFEMLEYDKPLEIFPKTCLTFKNAGHILGSAIISLLIDGQKLIYTSDLGNQNSLLLNAPEIIDQSEIIICEGTYGGRLHEDVQRRSQKLSEVITTTIAQNGVLLIPTFAIERTQELLHDIEHFCAINKCEKPMFFLDSPLATKVTAVFKKYPEFLSLKIREIHGDSDFFGTEHLTITNSREESQNIESYPNPKVIIAGSGMMNGGRILYHAQKYLLDAKNTILFVGYQPKGTIGRRLIEGERQIKIYGQKINVLSQVESIRSYSAHADQPQILEWLSNIKNVNKIFLVHGESDQLLSLASEIDRRFRIKAEIPQTNQIYQVSNG